METTIISVLIEREGDWWVAQCLQYDLATQARTLQELHLEIRRLIVAHMLTCEQLGIEPFQLPPAPEKFWAKYEASQVTTSVAGLLAAEIEMLVSEAIRIRPPKVETRIAA